MSKVIFYTPAFNAEKTLRRTVESVLDQTHTDFVYYLLDNASTDNTSKIIKEYAKRDQRIVPLCNAINWVGNWILDVIEGHSNECYLCELDADDEYTPDFLEKILAFMRENDLQIAACGSDFIDATTDKLIVSRKLDTSLILEGDKFEMNFSKYYQFMRSIWGKVYSLSVFRKPNYRGYEISGYGSDTYFAMRAFHNATRVGILAESLHRYYVFPKSVSYQLDENRITSDNALFDATRDFLISKCGIVSQENLNFLYRVYLNAIQDTVNVLQNEQMPVINKLQRLLDIFQSKHTQELIKWSGVEEQRNDMFNQVVVWVLGQKEVYSEKGLEIASDILAAMGVYPTKISGWQDCWTFMLLTTLKNRQSKMGVVLNIDDQIVSITSALPLIAGLNAEFLTYFRDIVFLIMQQDEKKALTQIESTISQQTNIPDEYIESFLTLGVNLSAKLNYAENFINFKKLKISLLIDFSRLDDAKEELADWDEILPNDIDFKELRGRLLQ